MRGGQQHLDWGDSPMQLMCPNQGHLTIILHVLSVYIHSLWFSIRSTDSKAQSTKCVHVHTYRLHNMALFGWFGGSLFGGLAVGLLCVPVKCLPQPIVLSFSYSTSISLPFSKKSLSHSFNSQLRCHIPPLGGYSPT